MYSKITATAGYLPKNIVTARLMTRRYVDALLSHREREVLIAGLWLITGFDQRSQAVKKHITSQTTYTLRRKFTLLVNTVTSFSNAPLVGIFYVGIFIFMFALVYIVYLTMNWLFIAKPMSLKMQSARVPPFVKLLKN